MSAADLRIDQSVDVREEGRCVIIEPVTAPVFELDDLLARMTPARYNQPRGMMIACPMTSRIKGYPFEVVVSREPDSAVLADPIKSLDWRARRAIFKGKTAPESVAEAQAKLKALPGF